MSKDSAIVLLIGAVILSGLGWLVVRLYEMNGILQSVNTKVTNTDQRVNRIAQALPSISIAVAAEEVTRPLQSAIVSTNPIKLANDKWMMYVSLIDTENDTQFTYTCSLESEDDYKVIWSVIGVGRFIEPNMRSAQQLTAWSTQFGDFQKMPSYVNLSGTLVFHQTSATTLKDKLSWIGPVTESVYIGAPIDWEELVEAVRQHPENFRPKESPQERP